MKIDINSMVSLVFLILSSAALATPLADISGSGNGGDNCEREFELIRDDIVSWIHKGGAEHLEFPQDLSANTYKSLMLEKMSAVISCTTEDISIGRAEKTCRNYVETDSASGAPINRIECNIQRFAQTEPADQYVLVHHEYAGLAGLETNRGESSNYDISNQITDFLEDRLVKKLTTYPTRNTGNYYCEAHCEHQPEKDVQGGFLRYILIAAEGKTPVEAFSRLRYECSQYPNSQGYLYLEPPRSFTSVYGIQASIKNSCKSF